MFFGHFFELQPSAFPFFCCLQPVFGAFWPSEGHFLTFFPERNAAGMSEGKKVKKRPSEGQKTQKRAEGNRKTEMLKAKVHKNAQKT